MDRTKDFSEGSVLKHIMRLALPMMAAQLINVLYNVIDRVYIGRMPNDAANALTGLGLCMPIITAVTAFTGLVISGATPLFSIARGSGNKRETEMLLGNSVVMLLVMGAVLTAAINIAKVPVLRLLGASDATLPYAKSYITIYSVGTLFVMLSLGLNGFINAQGFSGYGMFTVIIGAIINIVLDPVFIFLLGMGVAGAALATVISQFVSAVWTLKFLFGEKTLVKIKKSAMRVEPRRIRRIISLGFSGFVMAATNSAVSMVCNAQLAIWGGDTYIAVMTIISSVRDVLEMPTKGMTDGIQPVIGFNYGAGMYDRVRKAIRDGALIMLCYTGMMWLLVMLFGRYFMTIFTSDERILSAGAVPQGIYFFGFVFMTFQYSGQSTFVGLGKTKRAIFFSLLRKAVIVIPLTILLPYKFGVNGVFAAEPVSNIVGGSAAFTTMLFTVYRKLGKKDTGSGDS